MQSGHGHNWMVFQVYVARDDNKVQHTQTLNVWYMFTYILSYMYIGNILVIYHTVGAWDI